MKLKLFGRNYILTVKSDKGPRSENQDSFAWIHCYNDKTEGSTEVHPADSNPETFIAIVCDGMGGLKNGSEVSSAVCKELIRNTVKEHYSDLNEFINKTRPILKIIEETIRKELPNGGTTIAAIAAVNDEWCTMHIGDSRVYHGKNEWKRTYDHSPVESLFLKGFIDEDEALSHPMRNVISKYIGGGYAEDLEIGMIESDEEIILCSDGAFGYMPHNEFINLISHSKDADEIVRTALAKGSRDNVTVLCLITDESDSSSRK